MTSEMLKRPNMLSSKFDRLYPECGASIPRIPIDVFLFQNIETEDFKKFALHTKKYWKGRNLRNFCFDVIHEKNNGHEEVIPEVKKTPVNPERKEELYKTLVIYTDSRIKEFKEKEELGIPKDELKKERDEILGFVRAREALKDNKAKHK